MPARRRTPGLRIYTVPKAEFIPKYLQYAAKDWQLGWFSNYQSGQFLPPPVSPTLNLLPSEEIRVPGQPLYAPGVNINNLGTYNAATTQVLNPNAWAPCPVDTTCGAANVTNGFFGPQTNSTVFYKDFRAPRTPTENLNFGRNFRFGPEGRFNLFIRAEFVNIFNRTLMPAPNTGTGAFPVYPQNPVLRAGPGGPILFGWGAISGVYNTPGAITSAVPPFLQGRTGTLIARFSF